MPQTSLPNLSMSRQNSSQIASLESEKKKNSSGDLTQPTSLGRKIVIRISKKISGNKLLRWNKKNKENKVEIYWRHSQQNRPNNPTFMFQLSPNTARKSDLFDEDSFHKHNSSCFTSDKDSGESCRERRPPAWARKYKRMNSFCRSSSQRKDQTSSSYNTRSSYLKDEIYSDTSSHQEHVEYVLPYASSNVHRDGVKGELKREKFKNNNNNEENHYACVNILEKSFNNQLETCPVKKSVLTVYPSSPIV